MMQQSRRFLVLVLLLATVAAGCGRKDGRVPVRGTVTYRGQPLPNALVVFMPETPGVLPSSGLTDRNGRYQLMTTVPGDGAAVGKHRVTITARKPDKELKGGARSVTGSATEPGAPLIPTKYFMPDTSGLTAEVKPGGITADFKLSDK
jgi:hypothetical protein